MRARSQNPRKIRTVIFLLDVVKRGLGRARLPPPLGNRRPPRFTILHDSGRLERDCGSSVGAAHVEAVHLDVGGKEMAVGNSHCTGKCLAPAANVASGDRALRVDMVHKAVDQCVTVF